MANKWLDNLKDLWDRLTAARAGYLDELDFDLNARLGTPAGASLAADLLTIDNLVDDLETAVGVIEGATTLHNKLTAARAALLDQITALRMAELDPANLPADVAAISTTLANATYGLAALETLVDDLETAVGAIEGATTLHNKLTVARAGYLDALNTGVPVNSRTAAYGRLVGVPQVIEVPITSAANAGNVTVATVTTQPCIIESVVIHADAAQTANMTTCAIYGGAGNVVTFISTTDATQANLNAADKQVGWTGAVRLAATKTIVINLLGTGAAAVDLTITIKYRACVAGGYLT